MEGGQTSPCAAWTARRLEAGVAEYTRSARRPSRRRRRGALSRHTIRLTRDEWRPTDPRHLALLLDITLLYTIALVDAAHYVNSAGRSDVASAVATYVGGGTAAMRDKRTLTKLVGQLLEQLATQGVQLPASVREAIRPVPAYTSEIATIVTAFMEAPAVVASLPWHIETLQRAAVLGLRDRVGELVDDDANPEQTERSFRMVRDANPDIPRLARDKVRLSIEAMRQRLRSR
jgi:hypothetical protein